MILRRLYIVLIGLFISFSVTSQTRPDQQPQITDPQDTDAFYTQERGQLNKVFLNVLRAYYAANVQAVAKAYTPGIDPIPTADHISLITASDGNVYYIDGTGAHIQLTGLNSGGATIESAVLRNDSLVIIENGVYFGVSLTALETTASLPPGGSADEFLRKVSGEDYDVEWADVPASLSGSGTIDRIAKWSGSTALGNAILREITSGIQIDQGKIFAFDSNNATLPTAVRGMVGTITGSLFFSPSNGNWSQVILSDYFNSAHFNLNTVSDIQLANSGVTAGNYTNANISVDAFGRVTVATNGSAGGLSSATDTESLDLTVNSGVLSGRVNAVQSFSSSQGLDNSINTDFTLKSTQGTSGFIDGYHGIHSRGVGVNEQAQLLFDDSSDNAVFRTRRTGSWANYFVYHQGFPPDKLRHNSFLTQFNWNRNVGQDFVAIRGTGNTPTTGNYSGMYFPDDATTNHTGWMLGGRTGVAGPSVWVRNVNSGTFGSWFELYHTGNPPPGAADNLGDHIVDQDLIFGSFSARASAASPMRMDFFSDAIRLWGGSTTNSWTFEADRVVMPLRTTDPFDDRAFYVKTYADRGYNRSRPFLFTGIDRLIGQTGTLPTSAEQIITTADLSIPYQRTKTSTSSTSSTAFSNDPDLQVTGIPVGNYDVEVTLLFSSPTVSSFYRTSFVLTGISIPGTGRFGGNTNGTLLPFPSNTSTEITSSNATFFAHYKGVLQVTGGTGSFVIQTASSSGVVTMNTLAGSSIKITNKKTIR